jgi:hypothetical protein
MGWLKDLLSSAQTFQHVGAAPTAVSSRQTYPGGVPTHGTPAIDAKASQHFLGQTAGVPEEEQSETMRAESANPGSRRLVAPGVPLAVLHPGTSPAAGSAPQGSISVSIPTTDRYADVLMATAHQGLNTGHGRSIADTPATELLPVAVHESVYGGGTTHDGAGLLFLGGAEPPSYRAQAMYDHYTAHPSANADPSAPRTVPKPARLPAGKVPKTKAAHRAPTFVGFSLRDR